MCTLNFQTKLVIQCKCNTILKVYNSYEIVPTGKYIKPDLNLEQIIIYLVLHTVFSLNDNRPMFEMWVQHLESAQQ